jgi:hypothetical protein
LLSELAENVGASSCTFYVRDPIWSNEFHLVAMTGVSIVEAMYGFPPTHKSSPLLARSSKAELAISDTHRDKAFRPTNTNPRLFGNFAEREGVRALVRRVTMGADNAPDSILFVNYQDTQTFRRQQLSAIRRAHESLGEDLGAIRAQVVAEDGTAWLREIVAMLRPAQTALLEVGASLNLNDIATHALRAVGLTYQNGLATIHTFDYQSRILELKGSCGPIEFDRLAVKAAVDKREGVISWVASRRTPLLLRRVREGSFGSIYIGLNDRMQSELAVPILAGRRDSEVLIGVLNLEAEDPDFFAARSVKSVGYAASNAAVAHQLWKKSAEVSSVGHQLVQIYAEASTGSGEGCLDALASLAKKVAEADVCEGWIRDGDRWARAGATHPEIDQPRPGGWTDLIVT